jgi:hypothetical protein
MPSAEASHSRAEAGGLPPLVGVIARLVALIIAVGLISWLIGLSDVGTASLLLGASTVAVMVSLLGLGYWWSLSRVEGQAAVDEPRSESIERPTLIGAVKSLRAARRELRLAQLTRRAALDDLEARTATLLAMEVARRETYRSLLREREIHRSLLESEREAELRSRESWAQLAQSVQEARTDIEPPQKRRRAQRRQKEELAANERQ